MNKIRVGIFFGGQSAEHEVSLQSAKNVIEAIDKNKYEPILIGIDKNGRWQLSDAGNYLLNSTNPKLIALNKNQSEVALVPGRSNSPLIETQKVSTLGTIDVAFPVLHGPMGEDGTIQGLLKLANIPFVGAGVLGSAIGMDKDVMKRLLRDGGVPIARFRTLNFNDDRREYSYSKLSVELGPTLFIKPANMGSSVGVSKVTDQKSMEEAIQSAFLYDSKILIEEAISGREIEFAILGNENPAVSLPGEIIPKRDFYSYDAKYIDEDGAELIAPVELPKDSVVEGQALATQAFKLLAMEGMARADFFLTPKKTWVLNELNTIPGFTRISMYPKLWMASGISYPDLIDKLITLAIDRHKRDSKLKKDHF